MKFKGMFAGIAIGIALVSGCAFAAGNFDEALAAANKKSNEHDSAGAREILNQNKDLAATPNEKARFQKEFGFSYAAEGDLLNAEIYYGAALNVAETSPMVQAEVLTSLGLARQQGRQFEKAREAYSKVAGLRDIPPNLVVMSKANVASTYMSERDFAAAAQGFHAASLLNGAAPPMRAFLLQRAGSAYVSAANYDAAVTEFLAGLEIPELQPFRQASLQNSLGNAYLALKKPADARAAFQKTVDLELAPQGLKREAAKSIANIDRNAPP